MVVEIIEMEITKKAGTVKKTVPTKITIDNKTKKQLSFYVKPNELEDEYAKSLVLDRPTDKLVDMFFKIAKNLQKVKTNQSINSLDNNACVNYAVCEAWRKWKKYNPKKSTNLFSFFTTTILNDMRIHHKQITKGNKKNIYIESLNPNTF